MSDPHFQREDRGDRWRRIASQVERQPESLEVALENLERWERWGRVHPAPLKEWRRRILAAQQSKDEMRKLIRFLEMPNHDSEPIKSCSPFIGLTSMPRSATPSGHDS